MKSVPVKEMKKVSTHQACVAEKLAHVCISNNGYSSQMHYREKKKSSHKDVLSKQLDWNSNMF